MSPSSPSRVEYGILAASVVCLVGYMTVWLAFPSVYQEWRLLMQIDSFLAISLVGVALYLQHRRFKRDDREKNASRRY